MSTTKVPRPDRLDRAAPPRPPVPFADKIREVLAALGEDPDREGLLKTPERVEASLRFLTQGYGQTVEDVIGDAAPYLIEGMAVSLSVHEGVGIAIVLPQRATFEVVETEPTTKGQTASSSYKPAILSNGVKTAVPPHIAVGTRVVVMTEDGSYVERAKD